MWKRTKVTDQTGTGQTVGESEDALPDDKGIKRKSKVPGVMITQFLEELPEGKTTPDFTRKPIGLTIPEGKFAFLKAIVVGEPKPKVTWSRASAEILFHEHLCVQKYDEASHEHTLEFPKVAPDDADTYKCYATNEYGRAVCTVVLNVIAVGFSKAKEFQKINIEDTAQIRKNLKKRNPDGTREAVKPMATEEKIWEILLSADKKDYERICLEYGITDFRRMLKKLNEMKKEREEEIAQFITHIRTLKPIEVKDENCATIELDMDLLDPGSKIYLYKDGVMVPISKEEKDGEKHQLKQVGKKFIFTINKLGKDDAGLYSVDVEGVNVFSTDFKVPECDFALKIQEVKAEEREDALFQCVLTAPVKEIKWYGKTALLSNNEKHEITVSEDHLIHKLVIRDCMPLDAGIYAAVAGIKSCNAWLVVEADRKTGEKKKKAARKTTVAGATNEEELMRIAQEQQEKYKKEIELALKAKKRVRDGPLVPDTVIVINLLAVEFSDPGVHFHAGLSDCNAVVGESAALECKVSSEDCAGTWYKDGVEIKSSDDLTITKDGCFHRLKIQKVTEEYAGKYKFEADGRKTEAVIVVEDPPRFDAEEMKEFTTPVTVKKGQKAAFKIPYVGRGPIKVQWYLDGEELSDESNVRIEHLDGSTNLLLTKLQRKDSGEIKIKLKNEFGTTEICSQLVVLDKPTPPMGPLEIVEAGSSAVEFKWRAPKDNGGCKIENYILERQQVGRNTWKKVGPIGPDAKFRDTDVDHGRRYCYRIRVETEMGTSELMETEDIQAGTKAYPGPASAPKIVSAFKDCINISWSPPSDTGGTNILGFNVEKRKKGSNLWSAVNPPTEPVKGKQCAVKDVVEGLEYEFRVCAINSSGAGEFSAQSEFVFARDPKKPPGKVTELKVTDSTYTTLSLSWIKPKDIKEVEDEAKGYFVEIRPAENTEWDRCNTNPISMTSYTVKGMKSLAMYWVRVVATNDGGEGESQELDNYILAMPPPVRPRFTDAKIKSFMVVRAGNSARFNINFEASPWPEVIWLKDGVPVSKKVTVSNAEGTSQLLIPSSERSDTGIYTIIVKNIVGQETFSIEIRVTDEPKPPGPTEMDENVPGTVTISWTPSPDEKRDDRLHYMVTKRDSSKRTWHTVADRIFNNKFTACNIMPGREYQFRIYAKNDMGSSTPSETTKWLIPAKKEKFTVKMPESKVCDLQCPPKFIVPLKLHTAPQGYECYMTCAVKGDPKPHVTWLRNNISLNTNTNYFISNTCGVCSLLILTVGAKDTGEYTVVAESSLGRAESSTKLTVRE
ncbi:immunoglobulin-like and fibronectin type III domain-containing protein 1 [Cololabis saira]|uniref:immunoglobulin-like and fibronectin type III domain-containing protein 1 n=1 Tax=Cololabis saira TaxID=129043 RepID=UPI002AD2FFAA|nr:immunoglobulin-like and fibronectin type III domain-containing protein 1 [Cololabis saira]